ncbi:predicted protein [Chaetomium globosum CBS 148.51]|uniref:Uncharacterized protein n=1 Tax=Chaetomium globosum (strain ATCC 6205 / CBS 148.51 / DSM 1962 / NBRC 6347 / NRRL 1970) TaxID=306901 RepID=Q2HDP5_CHAGB|nr:uncharacterized protein CHGG_01659 [Chaetomium globosum CBS 148.51]EAQ93424.1 predicted protein [Chaetomium globosum CBS 148.51]
MAKIRTVSSRIRIFRKAPAWTDITGESRNKSQSNAALVCHRSQMLGGSPASSTTHLSISNPEKEGFWSVRPFSGEDSEFASHGTSLT